MFFKPPASPQPQPVVIDLLSSSSDDEDAGTAAGDRGAHAAEQTGVASPVAAAGTSGQRPRLKCRKSAGLGLLATRLDDACSLGPQPVHEAPAVVGARPLHAAGAPKAEPHSGQVGPVQGDHYAVPSLMICCQICLPSTELHARTLGGRARVSGNGAPPTLPALATSRSIVHRPGTTCSPVACSVVQMRCPHAAQADEGDEGYVREDVESAQTAAANSGRCSGSFAPGADADDVLCTSGRGAELSLGHSRGSPEVSRPRRKAAARGEEKRQKAQQFGQCVDQALKPGAQQFVPVNRGSKGEHRPAPAAAAAARGQHGSAPGADLPFTIDELAPEFPARGLLRNLASTHLHARCTAHEMGEDVPFFQLSHAVQQRNSPSSCTAHAAAAADALGGSQAARGHACSRRPSRSCVAAVPGSSNVSSGSSQ